jgi:hypothetical protein
MNFLDGAGQQSSVDINPSMLWPGYEAFVDEAGELYALYREEIWRIMVNFNDIRQIQLNFNKFVP